MSEFNVGDKVKCINDNDPYEDLIKGEVYSVVDVHDADGRIYISVDGRFRRRDNFSKKWFRDPHLFSLVEEDDQESLLTPLLLALGAAIVKHLLGGK